MLERFKKSFEKQFPFLQNERLYLAISGGIDSVVLLDLLVKSGKNPTLLHCNFQLRGEASEKDENLIHTLGRTYHLGVESVKFDTFNEALKRNKNIQETARELRYEWFAKVIDNKGFLLTAHHLNDRIETFYLNLLRGTGIKGLQSIPKIRNQIIRPLLNFTKIELTQYAESENLTWREDSSNATDNYLRNKIRHHLIPQIEELSENHTKKMSNLLAELEAANTFIETYSDQWLSKQGDSSEGFSLEGLVAENEFVLMKSLRNYGISRNNLAAFKKFLQSHTGSIFITENYEFTLSAEKLLVRTYPSKSFVSEQFVNDLDTTFSFNQRTYRLITSMEFELNTSQQQFDADLLKFPLKIRTWEIGDRIKPLGMNGTKLISKVLIDHKLSKFDKEKVGVVVDSSKQIICILDMIIDDRFKITTHTKKVLSISKNNP